MSATNLQPGVDPRHFLDGGMGREEAASAYLATMLEQSSQFRSAFLDRCGIQPFPIERIEVEHELRDVTIFGAKSIVIIEVKIADAAKTPGQLRMCYERVKADFPDFSVHAVYLARTAKVGESEVAQVSDEESPVRLSICS